MFDVCPYPAPTKESFLAGQKWEAFLYFVWEREAIRLARENGFEKPWTIDPIMAKYKFCNVRRKDDRVTKWLMSHIYDQRCNHQDLWFIVAICRLINWPPTLIKLDFWNALPDTAEEFDKDRFVSVIEELIGSGEKAYSGAYMTYPGTETGSNKSNFIAEKILEPLATLAPEVREAVQENTVGEVVATLSSSFGISTFIAGQIAADLTYYEDQLGKAGDLYEFAPIGPGSQAGLNYLCGNETTVVWKQGEFSRRMIAANSRIKSACGIMDLTLHDVQNCFCEFGKYARTLVEAGRPRTLYKAETEF